MRDGVLVSKEGGGSRAMVEKLHVRLVWVRGFGNYSCLASNSVGMQSVTVTVASRQDCDKLMLLN